MITFPSGASFGDDLCSSVLLTKDYWQPRVLELREEGPLVSSLSLCVGAGGALRTIFPGPQAGSQPVIQAASFPRSLSDRPASPLLPTAGLYSVSLCHSPREMMAFWARAMLALPVKRP